MDGDAKVYYRDRAVADTYFEKRFTTPKGAREHRALMCALEQACNWISEARSILDLPCGSGRFAGLLTGKSLNYFGADVSKEMLDILTRENRSGSGVQRLTQCDGQFLPFKSGAVDCVLSVRLFNLISRSAKKAVLDEMKRVSRRWLLVEVRHVKSSSRWAGSLRWRRWFSGGEQRDFTFDEDIASPEWKEMKSLRVPGTRHVLVLYEKQRCASG